MSRVLFLCATRTGKARLGGLCCCLRGSDARLGSGSARLARVGASAARQLVSSPGGSLVALAAHVGSAGGSAVASAAPRLASADPQLRGPTASIGGLRGCAWSPRGPRPQWRWHARGFSDGAGASAASAHPKHRHARGFRGGAGASVASESQRRPHVRDARTSAPADRGPSAAAVRGDRSRRPFAAAVRGGRLRRPFAAAVRGGRLGFKKYFKKRLVFFFSRLKKGKTKKESAAAAAHSACTPRSACFPRSTVCVLLVCCIVSTKRSSSLHHRHTPVWFSPLGSRGFAFITIAGEQTVGLDGPAFNQTLSHQSRYSPFSRPRFLWP